MLPLETPELDFDERALPVAHALHSDAGLEAGRVHRLRELERQQTTVVEVGEPRRSRGQRRPLVVLVHGADQLVGGGAGRVIVLISRPVARFCTVIPETSRNGSEPVAVLVLDLDAVAIHQAADRRV